jgi:hypothetical protein
MPTERRSGSGLHETQLENEIANTSNSVDELTERHLDVQNHLLRQPPIFYSLKKSKEEAAAAIDKRAPKNKMLDLQVELAGKILFLVPTNQSSFSGADVTLKVFGKSCSCLAFRYRCIERSPDSLVHPHLEQLWLAEKSLLSEAMGKEHC